VRTQIISRPRVLTWLRRSFAAAFAADPEIRLSADAETGGWITARIALAGHFLDQPIAERRQRAGVKRLGAFVVGNGKTNMVDHG
jgi:hypothetical protein